jgi:hypothetical protein
MKNISLSGKILVSIILIYSFLFPEITYAGCVWINKSSGLAAHKLTALAVDKENPQIIYAGSKGFLFKTVDGGKNWKHIFKVPGTGKAVNFIATHPLNSKIIYIAAESGIFKSGDAGINWQDISPGEKDNVSSLLVDSENKDMLFAGTENGILLSGDGGRNWSKSSEGLSGNVIKSIAQNYIDADIIFASTEKGLFKSENRGIIWQRVLAVDSIIEEDESENGYDDEGGLSTYPTWVSIDPFDPNIIYLATKKEIFKSENSADSWMRMTKAGFPGTQIRNIIVPSYERGFIFAATDEGIFRFSGKEDMWREFHTGLTSKEAVFVALNSGQDTLWLATSEGVFKSEGNIYETSEISLADKMGTALRDFSSEPSYHEVQDAAIRYAEVHPKKIANWRKAASMKALLPKFSFGVEKDSSKGLHWDAGSNPDRWVIGPEDEETGWDITCTWDLGDLVWSNDQTSIDVRSRLMVQLRDDVLDEVTRLYFERRKLQIELKQDPPEDVDEYIGKELRLQELTANIDAMTGGWFSLEIERRKGG